MLLTVRERLLLLGIIPQEGSFTTLKIIRKLREELSFSEEEHARFGFKETEQGVEWKIATEEDKDVEIGLKAQEIIAGALHDLDKRGKLHMDHISLFEKFVINEED